MLLDRQQWKRQNIQDDGLGDQMDVDDAIMDADDVNEIIMKNIPSTTFLNPSTSSNYRGTSSNPSLQDMDNVIIGNIHIVDLVEARYTNVEIDRIFHENENLHVGKDEIILNVETENPFEHGENENPPIVED